MYSKKANAISIALEVKVLVIAILLIDTSCIDNTRYLPVASFNFDANTR